MARKILVADLLCGAGGSSTGCKRALDELGVKMELVCVNHWPIAIETHKKNHPEARHYVQDIAMVRPHLIVPEGYLDLLMASPTCTHHSVARGGKPTSDQQRSDPWHIITWLTELRVKRLIIENVWEFISWGPVDARTGKPIQSRKGEYFRAWIDTIRRLSFDPQWKKLNAADFGEATTRQRFILMARSDGRTIYYPGVTHAKKPSNDNSLALFPSMQPWRPAREIIDWTLKGKSIFARKKPLAPKTLARIYAGAIKFNWPLPFLGLLEREIERSLLWSIRWAFAARHRSAKMRVSVRALIARLRHFRLEPSAFGRGGRSADPMLITLRRNANGSSVERPIPTVAANGLHIGLAQPVVVRTNMHGRKSPGARGSEDPLMTITTDGGIGMAEPVIMNGRKGNKALGVTTEPVPTLDTKGGVWLAQPFIATVAHGNDADEKNPNSRRAKSIDDPLGTIHGDGSAYAVIEPFILSQQNSGAPRSAEEPLPTITTGGAGVEEHPGCARPMLVEPFILNRHGEGYGEVRAHSVEEPSPTSSCRGAGYLIEPSFVLSRQSEGAPRSTDEPIPTQTAQHSPVLISPYYGSGSGETCQSDEQPLPTVTSKGRFGMVVPVTHAGEHRARDVNEDPVPTITTAHRGELAFITAQFGEREGQAPRVHDVGEPTSVGMTLGHGALVEPTSEYDILFRMLEPHELAAAMGFSTDEAAYEFAGTKTEQIKQIGNAVSVRMMKACVSAIMADVAPKHQEASAPSARAARRAAGGAA